LFSFSLERTVFILLFCEGSSIGFLRDGNPLLLLEDLKLLSPTIFIAVPRILNRLYDKTFSAINAGGKIKKSIFQFAFAQKLKLINQRVISKDTFWDKVVFKKIQLLFGGRIRFIIVGAAPISANVLTFFRVALGAHVFEG
jgi:long-chain acyl-CoA synthetase